MRKQLLLKTMLLLFALVAGSGTMWAETAGFSLKSTTTVPLSSGNTKTTTIAGTASETWDVTIVGTWTSSSMQGTSGSKYWQMGKSGSPITSATFSTSGISGVISSIVVNCAGGSISCTVGGEAFGTQNQSMPSWSSNSGGNVTFSGSASGKIEIVLTPPSSKATYIQSVTVTYVEKPAAPSFDVPGGEFNAAFNLKITSATGTTLKYTTDGTAPASSSTATSVSTNEVTVPIPAVTTRVRAIAIKNSKNSDETDVTYTYSSKEDPTFTLAPSPMDLKVGENGTLTLTTNSNGEISFSCEDSHVTLSGTGNSRTVTADAEGAYVINVGVAASDTYMAKNGSVTVNVTKYDTSVTIDATGVTLTDLKDGTAAGTLNATVTYGTPATIVSGASVKWESSNTAVATVNETTGEVTLVAPGSTNIKAKYAGDDTYNGSDNTYSLTVTDSRLSFSWNLATNSYDGTPTASLIQWSNPRATLKNEKSGSHTNETAVNNYIPTAQNSTRFYKYNELTITPLSGYSITSVEFTATTEGYASALNNSSWTNASSSVSTTKVVVTPTDGTKAISASIGATCGFTKVQVFYGDELSATISAASYATFCSADALDFSGKATVYTVTDEGSYAKLHEISSGKIPANTPVVLYKEGGTTINVPVVASADGVGENDLHLSTGAKYENAYVLSKPLGKNVGFYLWDSSVTLNAGKIYLQATSSSRSFLGFDDGETTDVKTVHSPQFTVHSYYNLNGQRVQNPQKGLYIVNGKKVVIK